MTVFSSHGRASSIELRLRAHRLLRGSALLFSRIELLAQTGDSVAVMGPSGIGKTSLLRALSVSDGDIHLEGAAPWSSVEGPVSPRPMGLLLQPDPIPPWLPVGAFLRAHRLADGRRPTPDDWKTHAREVCRNVGLDFDGIRRSFGRELSHGMQSRVALAGLVLCAAPVALVDEPFAGVDEAQREMMLPFIKSSLTGSSKLLIVVTHSPLEAMYLTDRVLIMPRDRNESQIVEVPPGLGELKAFLPGSREIRATYERLLRAGNPFAEIAR